ncbi:MAG: recombinase family protein [Bacteroidetes bacterium]|nr:recombinase family protein [Bacteroidota bacterium]
MKNVYGYIRVSTVRQGEGVSLIAQKEAIERYAEQYSLSISRWFEEKETAAKQGRPLFSSMMKLLRERKAVGVIMHKIDRSARNLKDWADLGNLIDQGIEVHFAHESLDLRARGGRLSADIQAVIAADYIRNLRQEAIKGLYGRLKQGIYPFPAPIGYKDMGKGKLKVIDPVKGPLVRKAFELYGTRKYSYHQLLAELHSLGLRNIRGQKLTLSGLSFMLNNPFYIGTIRVTGQLYKGHHEKLIEPSLFKTVQSIIRNKDNQKVRKHEFRYSKMLSCAHCGYSLIAETQKGHVYYRCHTKDCETKGVRETLVEEQIKAALRATELLPEEVATLAELLREEEQDAVRVQHDLLRSIRLQKAQLEQKLDRLTDTYVDGDLEKEIFTRKKATILMEIAEKEVSERKMSGDKAGIFLKVRKFLELAKSLISSFETGILEEKRELVEIVTSNLSVQGKKLMIVMKSPFSDLLKRYEFCLGAPKQNRNRTCQIVLEFPNNSLAPCPRAPLAREQLRLLLRDIISTSSELPDPNTEGTHGI